MLKRILITFANILWFLFCFKDYFLFKIACFNVEKNQKSILDKIISTNKNTNFGKNFGFNKIETISDFQSSIPITTYEDYMPYIEEIKRGKDNILTKDKVLLLEPTSGSTSASKYIPYTKSLQNDFQRGLAPWIFDLFLHHKKLFTGSSYWSITPKVPPVETSNNKVKLGFEEDSEYFGFLEKYLINFLTVMPKEVAQINNRETFLYVSLLFLIKDSNLSLISVWSPTFIDILFSNLLKWLDMLIIDLENGTINNSFKLEKNLSTTLTKKLGKNSKRAKQIEFILHDLKKLANAKSLYEKLWSNLTLISSWGDGNSSIYLNCIKKYFPNVEVQHKGLLATECFISFPMVGIEGHLLSIRSHFFEFLDVEDQILYLANQLRKGNKYSLIITTAGGLYRYRLGDVVEIIDFYKNNPIIKFVSREDTVSDLFGEKINEEHLKTILNQTFDRFAIKPEFYILTPHYDLSIQKHRYVLYIESKENKDFIRLKDSIEEGLKENFHYKYCRELGQLDEVGIFRINKDGIKNYTEMCNKYSQKIGDIKPKILRIELDWSQCFDGYLL